MFNMLCFAFRRRAACGRRLGGRSAARLRGFADGRLCRSAADLLGLRGREPRTLLGAPGLTTRNKKLLVKNDNMEEHV